MTPIRVAASDDLLESLAGVDNSARFLFVSLRSCEGTSSSGRPSEIKVAVVHAAEGPVAAIAELFRLRHTLGYLVPGIAIGPPFHTADTELLVRAGFVHCTHPVPPEDILPMIEAASKCTAPRPRTAAQGNGLLREARFTFRSHEEARWLAHLLGNHCPDPARQQLGIEELLLNAVEHGNLGIDNAEKAQLLLSGQDWQAELSHRLEQPQNSGKRVQVFWHQQANEISLSVVDEGDGFDHERWMTGATDAGFAPNGRGIALARAISFDSLEYLGRGNHVVAKIAAAPSDEGVNHRANQTPIPMQPAATTNVFAQLDELLRLNLAAKQDQDMALRVLTNVLSSSQLKHPAVRCIQAPLEKFSGDCLLVHPLPHGGLRVFLGDFAGHGLAAAIGTIPLASIFFATVRKGVPLAESISTINQKLHELLPPSMFCAATILEVNSAWNNVQLFTAGTPPVLINQADSGATTRWATRQLPLGVVPSNQLTFPLLPISVSTGDRLLLYSDGVTEQRNGSDELFGIERLERVIQSLGPGADVIQKLLEDLSAWKGREAASDDLTCLELTIVPPGAVVSTSDSGTWAAVVSKD
ncbi:MAG: ATP-binding SpoIIE family protein phosphatase [Deltaproteobacteria bacterium]|nr:ATP-binding SpoIIE family protein phosphatase [Deltaproteobacteria bacterium]